MTQEIHRLDFKSESERGDLSSFNRRVFDTIDRDGAVIVERALESDIMEGIVSEMQPYIDATPHGLHGLANSRRVGALVARSPSSHRAIAHPTVLDVCERILGQQARMGNEVQVIQAPRGKGKYPWRLGLTQVIDVGPGQTRQPVHRGNGLWVHNLAGHNIDPQVETMWALSDFCEENGATHVVIGSHRWPDVVDPSEHQTMTWYQESDFPTVQASMPKGSVLIWTGWTVHGAGANNSQSRRLGMNIDYSLSFLSQEENQFLACPPRLAKTLSREMQHLIGYSQPAGALNYFADCLPPRYSLLEDYDVLVPGAHGMKRASDLSHE
ncbi:MAG: phytanoyl-CoA dioxygenase family protein [Gammaproteobacteria bacterium]|nr:phytanoyl-CoA dioxygenase family protein [Gammaproteobacteria bacterium]